MSQSGASYPDRLPEWADEMRDLYKSGSVSQFILHGNVFDEFVTGEAGAGMEKEGDAGPDGPKSLSLAAYLDRVMFSRYDVILHYDRGKGIRPTKGAEDFSEWIEGAFGDRASELARSRSPGRAMELLDRYLLRTLNLMAIGKGGSVPRRIAVIVSFAEFVVPQGNPLHLGDEFSANTVKVLGWANDPAILHSNIATVLLTEGLRDLNDLVTENPHAAKIRIPLPDEEEMLDYVDYLRATRFPDLSERSDVPPDILAGKLTGLSRIGARRTVARAIRTEGRLTSAWLSDMKKEMIERECQGLLEFLESPYTLDHVAGHEAAKAWLREDTELLRRGIVHALPMGYLFAGRIGTGKTFLVQCWAGELGIPCVVFKNFRDRWVGATESNLEKIFSILRALGQVVVFVDEADQMTGKRGGGDNDSGLSGRVYAMLAKEMSDTQNRGKIIWVFATSRPDLLEVDLKRQGRLDVHIPLFPPQTVAEMAALFRAIAGKLRFPLAPEDLPEIPEGLVLGGNEIEGVLVRAVRTHALAGEPRPAMRDILAGVIAEVRPSPHTRKLEYMDLIAAKECTDSRFLPERLRALSLEALEARIGELRRFMRE